MPALQTFLEAELHRRGWSIPEFAEKVDGLSQSNAYLIIRDGQDNVKWKTFVAIADALRMTPGDLTAAIGMGGELTPDEAAHLAAYRRVPEGQRSTATQILHGFAVQPTRRAANRRRDEQAKRKLATARELERADRNQGDDGAEGLIVPHSVRVRGLRLNPIRRMDGRLVAAAHRS